MWQLRRSPTWTCNVLNRHLRWWYETHDVPKSQDGQGGYTGGVSTPQGSLRALFHYLADEYGHPNPYLDPALNRYAAPALGKPKTLSEEFIQDVLTLTAWGTEPERRDFGTVRDHALLRVLTEGLRAEEILNLHAQDLDLPNKTLVVVPLKGQRNSVDARPIPCSRARSRCSSGTYAYVPHTPEQRAVTLTPNGSGSGHEAAGHFATGPCSTW